MHPLSAHTLRRAVAHLKRGDPKLATVIETVGRCTLVPRTEGTHFEAVARAIAYQQLSGKAAATIYGRFAALFDGGSPEAGRLLALPDDTLRGAGLSRQKIGYLRDLATRAQTGTIPLETLHELSDADVMTALMSVKGVGRWTAQAFLIFRLGRLDVLPELDLGIQKALRQVYRLRSHPTPQRVLDVGARWAPYRSVAAWYLWRHLDMAAERNEAERRTAKQRAAGKRAKAS